MDDFEDQEQGHIQEVNPFTTIWYAPSRAIRSVITYKPTYFAIIIAMLVGITDMFETAISEEFGDHMSLSVILVTLLVGGILSGVLGMVITVALSQFIGKLLGGIAKFREVFMAIGAASIPAAFTLAIYLIDLVVIGENLFVDVELSGGQVLWLLFSAFVTFVLSTWTLFLTIKSIAEAHQFSFWKGLLTFIIPVVTIFLLFFGLIFIVRLLF